MKRRLLNLLTDCREKRWVFLLLSSTRAVRAMACLNHYFPGPHTWRTQSPAVPSPPPSSHVFTLQLCSRNGYSVVRNFCGIKFPPVLESYIQTHPICFWLINVRKVSWHTFQQPYKIFLTQLGTVYIEVGDLRYLLCWGNPPVHTQISRFIFFTFTWYVG